MDWLVGVSLPSSRSTLSMENDGADQLDNTVARLISSSRGGKTEVRT
jgi:hypothetical protein